MAHGFKTGGRKKGTPNKNTSLLKDAILEAAALCGQDKNGKGELIGYLQRLAEEQPTAFAGLLGRVLPLQVNADVNGEMAISIVTRHIVDPKSEHSNS